MQRGKTDDRREAKNLWKMKILHCPAWKVKNCHFNVACANGGSPTLGVSPTEKTTVNIAICDVPGEGLC